MHKLTFKCAPGDMRIEFSTESASRPGPLTVNIGYDPGTGLAVQLSEEQRDTLRRWLGLLPDATPDPSGRYI